MSWKLAACSPDQELAQTLRKIQQAMVAVSQSVSQYKQMEDSQRRADCEFNMMQRDRYIRLNEFKKQLNEREAVTVQNHLRSHGMRALDKDEHAHLQKMMKRKTPEEDAAEDEQLRIEYEKKKESELQLQDMQHNSRVAQQAALGNQLESEMALLEATIASLKQEADQQKDFTVKVANVTIAAQRAKKPRLTYD